MAHQWLINYCSFGESSKGALGCTEETISFFKGEDEGCDFANMKNLKSWSKHILNSMYANITEHLQGKNTSAVNLLWKWKCSSVLSSAPWITVTSATFLLKVFFFGFLDNFRLYFLPGREPWKSVFCSTPWVTVATAAFSLSCHQSLMAVVDLRIIGNMISLSQWYTFCSTVINNVDCTFSYMALRIVHVYFQPGLLIRL